MTTLPHPGTLITTATLTGLRHSGRASNPYLVMTCECGEAFESRYFDVKTRVNDGKIIRCRPCAHRGSFATRRANARNQHAKCREAIVLTEAEQAKVSKIVWDHLHAMERNGTPIDARTPKVHVERVLLEAAELVVMERTTGEDSLPKWTAENINEGLWERCYNQYQSPIGMIW